MDEERGGGGGGGGGQSRGFKGLLEAWRIKKEVVSFNISSSAQRGECVERV